MILTLFLTVFPLSLHASEWEGRVIHQITLNPSEKSSEIDLFQQIGLRPGERYQTRQVRRAIKQLYETGRFNDIWVVVEPLEGEEISVTFVLIEKRLFSSIHISGNYRIPEEEILEAMGFKPGEEFTENRLEKALSNVSSLYRREGYFQAKWVTQLKHAIEDRRRIEVSLEIDEGTRTKVRNVHFTGEKVFSDRVLRRRMWYQRKGEFYLFRYLEKDIKRLEEFYREAGYLKAIVGPPVLNFVEKTNEVDITMPVQSFNKIELFFEGRGPFSEETLKQRLLIKEERSDEEDVLVESARQIERFYRNRGYPFANVSVTSKRIPEQNRMEARFKIKSGARTQIRKIEFSGNHTFSGKRLQKMIRLEKEGTFFKSLYTEEKLQEDRTSLTQFYKKEGFRNVHISSEIRFDAAQKFATIIFKVDEGVRTRIRQVEIRGSHALSEKVLRSQLKIGPEMPYHDAIVKEGSRQLLFAYAKEGYLYAHVESSIDFSEDQTTADITYHLSEGKQVRLGRIKLEGNLRTKDHVLLREMVIQEAEPYNLEKVLKSQHRLYRTGLFSSIRFDPIRPEEQPTNQDVQLSVVERPSIALEFGFGYADRERLRGFFEIANRNLFGTGRQISARAEGSAIEERYTLSYKEPWFLSQNIDARLAVAYLDLQQESFDLETFSSTAGLDKSFSESVKGSLLYQYELKNTTHVKRAANQTPADIGKLVVASINPSLIRDTRDDPFNPRSGSVNGITFRNAAKVLGSEVQLVKATLQSSWYVSLSPRWVFAFSARAGVAERFGETQLIPLSERFFLGGRSTVRGYDQDKLGILGSTIQNGDPTGGNAMLVFNEELRFFLPRSLGLVFFLDHGNVWRNYQDIALSQIKSTTGIGLRYNTPVGPFRLDWGYKLNREAGESPWAIHFTLGHAF